MSTPIKFELYTLVDSLEERTFEQLKNKLHDISNNIVIKEYEDSNLVLIANNYTKDIQHLTDLEKECRSVIIDKETLEVIHYTYDNIYYNEDAKNYLLSICSGDERYTITIQECFEGTLLSVYNYNDKWMISTRKCLDANESKWNNDKTHYELFLEVIEEDFDTFTKRLNPDYCYLFVLVHHENKNIIHNDKNIVDYTRYLGDSYKNIVHILSRKRSTHEEVNVTNPVLFTEKHERIIHPQVYEDYSKLDEENSKEEISLPLTIEGLVVKVFDNETGKSAILKLQTNTYQMMSSLNPNNNNIYKSFVELYQHDKLRKHLEYFSDNAKIKNPLFSEEPYDTLGVVDATFKVITSELLELFKALYLRGISHRDRELYDILPKEYKTVLYRMRGIFFQKRENYYKNLNKDDEERETKDMRKINLQINDIYQLLKSYNTKELLDLMYARKVMKHTADNYSSTGALAPVYQRFRNISSKMDRISLKMIAILLNNMYPEDVKPYYCNMVEI